MDVGVGTFNLNNLFSRFNFRADLETTTPADPGIAGVSGMAGGTTAVPTEEPMASYSFGEGSLFVTRTYRGRLVRGKPERDTERIANRILQANLDVLAVQEVEDLVTLRGFDQEWLNGLYPYSALVDGNDPRLIDLAVLSKLPIGGITSWQWAVHPDDPSEPVFSRDLLEVEILSPSRRQRLFTLYNNHLKSHYVPFDADPVEGARRANERRQRQAAIAARIVAARQRPNGRFIVLGDMNDPPDSPFLAPLAGSTALMMTNGLANPRETRPAPDDDPPPPGPAWTHRFKPRNQPAEYELFDHVWLSPALSGRLTDAVIDRRTRLGGDGSDHDLAWVTLDL
ncbi:MAG: endonuclease/exonuclease/phosphatase family protein [Thermomicrobiales bacterium]